MMILNIFCIGFCFQLSIGIDREMHHRQSVGMAHGSITLIL